MSDTVIHVFCIVDDFCQLCSPWWNQDLLEAQLKKRNKPCRLCPSEIMTIFIYFHQFKFRDFKSYYTTYVQVYLNALFPRLVSYNRFVELLKTIFVPLCFFAQSFAGKKRGVYFVDSTMIKVCHIKREKQHQVFKGLAQKSKSTIGWFYGFQLHLVINGQGELMAFKVTAANVDGRKPVPDLVEFLTGKLIGDKGYISHALCGQLADKGLQLISRVRKNMQTKCMSTVDKILLRKRAIIESVNDQLKNISQLEHTRHRSIVNFAVNIMAALVAYSLQPKKPSLNLNMHETKLVKG